METRHDISRTVEDKRLLLSANRKSYMPHRLSQQRMTLNDLEWPFRGSASRVTSVVAELLALIPTMLAAFPRIHIVLHYFYANPLT